MEMKEIPLPDPHHSSLAPARPPPYDRLTPLRNALDDDEIAVVTQADGAVNAMFKKPLRVGLLVEPTVSPPNLWIPLPESGPSLSTLVVHQSPTPPRRWHRIHRSHPQAP